MQTQELIGFDEPIKAILTMPLLIESFPCQTIQPTKVEGFEAQKRKLTESITLKLVI